MIYEGALSGAGYDVIEAATAQKGLEAFYSTMLDIVLLDLTLPDRDGLSLMREMQSVRPNLPVIVTAEDRSIPHAVEAMQAGAQNFLVKPFDEAQLISAVSAARLQCFERADPLNSFIGTSDLMGKTYAQLRAAARSNAPVFITGESGSGKALCARTIHGLSARSRRNFVPVHCAGMAPEQLSREFCGYTRGAFPEARTGKTGAAMLADGGTLYIDDLCDLNLDQQAKLLGFLEGSTIYPLGDENTYRVDTRIICATSRDPAEELRMGRLREDLFYRLHVVPISVPPLRARGADIMALAQHSLTRISQEEERHFDRISPDAAEMLQAHPWPGNIRQLINALRLAVVMYDGPVLEAHMLLPSLSDDYAGATPNRRVDNTPGDASIPPSGLIGQTLAQIERAVIEAALQRNSDSVPKTARELDVAPSTLYRKIASWDVSEDPAS
jgi:DNA-binding NtrC family response regulator